MVLGAVRDFHLQPAGNIVAGAVAAAGCKYVDNENVGCRSSFGMAGLIASGSDRKSVGTTFDQGRGLVGTVASERLMSRPGYSTLGGMQGLRTPQRLAGAAGLGGGNTYRDRTQSGEHND